MLTETDPILSAPGPAIWWCDAWPKTVDPGLYQCRLCKVMHRSRNYGELCPECLPAFVKWLKEKKRHAG